MNEQPRPTTARWLGDSLANLLTGMGILGRDKGVSSRYVLNPLTRDQLDAAYRGDWVARKAVNIPAYDATREWRSWQADKGDITLLEEEEKRLDIQRKLKRAMILGRLYGGGALLIGAGDTQWDQELVLDSVGKGGLRYLHYVSCNVLAADELESDVESPYFGLPKSYELTSQKQAVMNIHPSRVVRFLGSEVPDPELSSAIVSGWGDSVIQVLDEAIKNVGTVSQGVAQLINEAKLDVIKLQQLDEMVSTAEYRDNLSLRMQVMNTMKSMWGVTLLDMRDEWDRKQITFAELPDIMQMYLLIASGASDIPVTRFLGQSPAGMNATGESDIRNYYDRVRADQTTELTPTMHILDECIVRSAFGSRPDDVWYEWRPLWAMSENEKADVAYKKAQAFKIDVDTALIDENALREGRENQLIEDGFYPGFEQALEEAEAAREQALNELDPEVRAQAEQHELEKKAGVPQLPPPSMQQQAGPPGGPDTGGPPRPRNGGGGPPRTADARKKLRRGKRKQRATYASKTKT